MKKIILIIFAFCILLPMKGIAANPIDDIQLKARLGYSIGGTAPLGIPATIRSLDAYRLTPSFLIGIDAKKPLKDAWGIQAGLHFENKGMDADVTTKGYHMEMVKGDSRVKGLFFGHISQEVTQWMLTIPVQVTYDLSDKVMLKGGPYASFLLNKDFSGIASDGYLREGNPTGAKIIMGDKEGEWATYDFSASVNPDLDIDSFVFPANDNADEQLLNSGIDLQFCVMKDCKNKEAAYEVLNFLLEDESIQIYLDEQNAVPCKDSDFTLPSMLDGMKTYIDEGKMVDYQDHYYPSEMSVDALIQTYLMEGDTDAFLENFDKQWIRYNRDLIRKVQNYEAEHSSDERSER